MGSDQSTCAWSCYDPERDHDSETMAFQKPILHNALEA